MPVLKEHNTIYIPRSRLAEQITKKQGTLRAVYDLKGDCYKGEWKNNKKHGIGELKTYNGYFYLGQWINNQKHGYGILKKYNNDKNIYDLIYEGEWENDLQHGQGVSFSLDDGSFYEGDFKFGYKNGYGSMMYIDGSYYNGEWINGKMDGVGILTSSNGNYFHGEFSQGMKNGRGIYVMPQKLRVLRGVWNDDIYFSGESLSLKKEYGIEENEEVTDNNRKSMINKVDCATTTDR